MTRKQKRIKRELNELKKVKELKSDKQNQVVGGIINDGKQDQLKSSFNR